MTESQDDLETVVAEFEVPGALARDLRANRDEWSVVVEWGE